MLRAYILYVALMVSLMVAVICGSLLTLHYLNDREYYMYETDRRLRDNVESTFNWIRVNEVQEGTIIKDLYEENKDSVEINTQSWGLLNMVKVKAFSGDRFKQKSALMGPLLHSTEEYALFMANSNKPLSLCGQTKLVGKCFVPAAGVERAYIEGQNFMGNKLINGEEKTAPSSLPETKKEKVANIIKYLNGNFNQNDSVLGFNRDSLKIINIQSEKVLVLRSEGTITLSSSEYKGKIIVWSAEAVYIKKSTLLQDIQVFAPVITIEDGFQGSGQFFASDSLNAGKNCDFQYPSVLAVVNTQKDKMATLILGEGSHVKGALISFQEQQTIRNKNVILMEEKTELYGQVYSNGFLDLKGKVFGSVVCSGFILKTPSSVYENHLLNAVIDITRLPKKFVGVDLLKVQKRFAIIKYL